MRCSAGLVPHLLLLTWDPGYDQALNPALFSLPDLWLAWRNEGFAPSSELPPLASLLVGAAGQQLQAASAVTGPPPPSCSAGM